MDNFKPLFKYYKQKLKKPSFGEVVDFSKSSEEISSYDFEIPCDVSHLGLRASKTWKVLEAVSGSGLYFICNPFSDYGRKLWSRKCLETFCMKPNKTNLDEANSFYSKSTFDSLWNTSPGDIASAPGSCLRTNSGQLDFLKTLPIWNLRWSTIGYHHDWDTKNYSDNNKSLFPDDLNEMSKLFALAVGCSDYMGEAAIINYYHVGSTLCPHTDHSERFLGAPLVSISFGLPAVFLMGGKTKTQKPTAMLVRSGDVMIMTGQSRLAFHAVPRILDCEVEVERRDPVDLYLAHSRINMNIRQVNNKPDKLAST